MSDGSAGDLITVLLNPSTMLGLSATVLMLAASLIAHRIWPHRVGWYQILTLASLLVIVSLTQLPTQSLGQLKQIDLASSLKNAVTWPSDGVDLSSTFSSSGWWLNIALFVPLGIGVAGLLNGRFGTSTFMVAVFAFAIETGQAVTGFRGPDLVDFIANTLGGVVGFGLWTLSRPLTERVRERATGISPALSVAVAIPVVVLAVALAAGFLLRSADSAQIALMNELEDTYQSTSLESMQDVFFDETGEDQPFDEFLTANSVRPDSVVRSDAPRTVQVRYSDQYFGLNRCVFVTWQSNGVAFERDSGDRCTQFLGS